MKHSFDLFRALFTGVLLAPLLLIGCDRTADEVEVPRELVLSVSNKESMWIETDDVDFHFEILDGNGGYVASISETGGDKEAAVSIDGNKVTVNLLSHLGAMVTITDSKNQKDSVRIIFTHESLRTIPSYGLYLEEGQTYAMEVDFGAGAPYTIEKTKGNASKAVVEGDKIKATSLGLGNTHYKIRDRRGTIARFVVSTSLSFQMEKGQSYLEFSGVNNMSASIRMQWGEEWKIIGYSNRVIEKASVSKALIATNVWSDYYVLFIDTAEEGKGSDIITMRNKEGDLAAVKVIVK